MAGRKAQGDRYPPPKNGVVVPPRHITIIETVLWLANRLADNKINILHAKMLNFQSADRQITKLIII